MANRYDIVHIDFQASARGANAAIESIRKEAEKSSAKLEQMRKDIDNAVKAGNSDETIAQMRSELKAEETRYKQFKAAQNELIKGMRVLDQAVQQFNNGSLGEMNAAFQKAAYNAAKLAQSKMTTGTDEWRQMAAIMQETEQNYSRMQRDTDQLIQTIQSGGTVFVNELEKEKRGLEELMKLVPYMGQEYQKLQGQYTIVTEKLDKMAIAERQAKGEIVTLSDALRVANQLTEEGASKAERDRQTAEQTIATSKEKIATLEKERVTLEANARASADIVATHTENIRAKEADIAATEKQIKKDEQAAGNKRRAAEANRKAAEEMVKNAADQKTALEGSTALVEGLTEEIKLLDKEIENLGKEPIKPKVDDTAVKQIKDELTAVEQKLQNVANYKSGAHKTISDYEAKYGKTSEEQMAAQDRLLQEAIRKDAAANEEAVNKVEAKWKTYWEKQEAAAKKFAATLGKSLEEIDFEDITKHLEGPMAEKAKSAYRVVARREYELGVALFGEGKLNQDKETAIRYEGNDSPEAKVIESMQRKYREYTKELREANSAEAETKPIRDALKQETTAYHQALGQLEGAQKVEGDLLKQQGDLQKQLTEAQQQSTQATKDSADADQRKLDLEKQRAELDTQLTAAKKQQKQDQEAYNNTLDEAEKKRKKANKQDEEANTLAEKHKGLLADQKKELEGLNTAAEKDIQTNERNQRILQETNAKIAEQGQKIREAEALRTQATTRGVRATEEAIRILEKENAGIDTNSDQWRKNTATIIQLQKELDKMRNQQALQMMEGRMQNVTNLSNAAVTETKKFWQAMYDGADRNDPKLKEIEQNLKRITAEEEKRSRAALEQSAGRLKGDLGNLSSSELRQAIEDGKKLQATYKETSREARELANQILNAEEYAKSHGIEAMRQARKEQEALRQQEEQERELARTMTARLHSLKTLSADATAEARKYWEAQKNGAEEGTAAFRKAELALSLIDKQQAERTRQRQEQLAARLNDPNKFSNYTTAELKESVDAAKQLAQSYKSGSKEAQDLTKNIVAAEEHISKYSVESERAARKEAKAIQEMQDQLAKGTALTESALKAQANYWQRMIDDPKNAGQSLKQYEDNLKEVKRLQEEMVKDKGKKALDFFEKGEDADASADKIKEKVADLKRYRDSLPQQTEADTIAKINEYLVQAGESAKKAAAESMTFKQALQVGKTAGTGSFKGTVEQLTQAKKVLEDMSAKAVKGGLAWRRMQEALQRINIELKNVGHISQEVQAVLDNPKGRSFNQLKQAVEQGRIALNAMDRSTKEGQKAFDELAKKIKACDLEMKTLGNSAKGTVSAFDKAWSRLKTYVGLYVGAAVAMQKVTATMGDLMELSDKMGEVRKTTGFTADEVGRLTTELKKLDTRTTLTSLMELSSIAGSIGLKTQQQVQGFTEAANMLTVALPEMGNEASRTFIKIADATGDLEKNGGNVRETLEKVGSTIIALRANSAAAAGPITDFVSRVGAVGAQAGISIDQIAALGATVDALGGRVEMSATALSRMIPAIKNNSFAVAQAIGMTEKELKGMDGMQQMVAIFRRLHDSVKDFDMTTEEGMNAAADAVENMMGKSTSMQEVMKTLNQQGARAGIVFGLLSQNVDMLEKQLGIAGEAYQKNTALMDEYNKMNDTTAAKWERLKNSIEEWFISDRMQRWLGEVIDMLRKFANWFAADGVLAVGFKALLAYAAAMKVGFGAAFVGMGGGLKNLGIALGAAINQMGLFTRATATARVEWKKLDTAVKANIWGAVISALAILAFKLWDIHEAAKEAAAEIGRFNQEIAKEQKAVSDLFDPLNKSNLAQKERLDLIKEINSKYGKYLGYMLSETSSAIQLADAHALIAKRIREEAYERRIAEKEKQIQEQHDEDVNAAYARITDRVRGSERGGASAQEIADVLKGIVDSRLGSIKYAWDDSGNIFKARTSYYLDPKIKQAIDGGIERLIVDGKLSRDNVQLIQKAVYKYTVEAHDQHKDIMNQTANLRSDLRGIQGAIKYDLANNLNTLISNVANRAVRSVQQQQQSQPMVLRPSMPTPWGGGQQQQQGGGTQWKAPWQGGGRETTPDQQMAPKGWKPDINKKDIEAVRQFVKDQDALRSALQASGEQIDEAQRKVAESWLLADEQLKEYRKIVEKADRGPGGSTNPYGDFNRVTSPYSDWSGNDLVARRKEMLERVKALANGADVQAVLSEDAKFISEAVRKNIKTTEQAIEWYNQERLKIQDALYNKHLTPTGDWLDPKKGGTNWRRQLQTDFDSYLKILDAYYTERKARIQQAQAEEGMSEAEAQRLTIENETVWRKHRMELQQIYQGKGEKIAKEERQRIYDILAEQDEDSADMVEKTIAKSLDKMKLLATKSEVDYNKIMSKLTKDIATDLFKQQDAVAKQVEAIRSIIAKERPFNGLTENLEKNLSTMGILFADLDKIRREAIEKGLEPEDDTSKRGMEQTTKRMLLLLKEAENAYSLTWEQLKEKMQQEGLGDWAAALEVDEQKKQAVIASLHSFYDSVQDAIKKEASQIKKQTDIIWNDAIIPGADGQNMSMKGVFDKAISQLGLQESRVSRANSLIGAGQASERVADKLAIQQLKVKVAMQQAYYDLIKKKGADHIAKLEKEAELLEKQGLLDEAAIKRLDVKHAKTALALSDAEEQTKIMELQNSLAEKAEESQNRLYTELKEWGDLLASSLQSIFEASAAGNEEYYNELAKLNLTGKGGPGAGTYVVIDDAGTEDATAHYEYLDERQALERQHKIEQENAKAEAWKKVMDDINAKLSETITDQLNAMLQNAAVYDNTAALKMNTDALKKLTEETAKNAEATVQNAETTAKAGTTTTVTPQVVVPTGDKGDKKQSTIVIEPLSQGEILPEDKTTPVPVTVVNPNGEPLDPAFLQGGNGQTVNGGNMGVDENGVPNALKMPEATEGTQGYGAPWMQPTQEQPAQGEWMSPMQPPAFDMEAYTAPWEAYAQANTDATKKVLENDKKAVKSNKASFAAMTAAANMYGIAYQTMSNDNLSTAQKVEMMIVQAAGQALISMLTAQLAASQGQTAAEAPSWISKTLSSLGPIAGPVAVGVFTALIGGLMGVAVSKIGKSKSQIAQATGTSGASAGKLSTGMLTYAEGNVNEFTNPDTLTPGRQYNVDAADGKTYRARYMGSNPRTHITNGPEFHLAGEAGREMIIDAGTTRQITMNEGEIWHAIQTLSNGGYSRRRNVGHGGMRAFKDGNVDDFDFTTEGADGTDGTGMNGMTADQLLAFQASLDRNSAIMERLAEEGIEAFVSPYGKRGIVNGYDHYKKEAQRQGVKY